MQIEMLYRHRMLWPKGSMNPEPIDGSGINHDLALLTFQNNEVRAAAVVASLADFHPGYPEVE